MTKKVARGSRDPLEREIEAALDPGRFVGERMAELEIAIADRRQRLTVLAEQVATTAPTLAEVARLFDRQPILATSLDAASQGELRALFAALQLDVVYQPADGAVDVAVTLYDRGGETAESAAQVLAEDWSVPPAGFEPAHMV